MVIILVRLVHVLSLELVVIFPSWLEKSSADLQVGLGDNQAYLTSEALSEPGQTLKLPTGFSVRVV